jgi:hypothetical protein
MTIFLEFLGWVGTFLIIYAYYKNSIKKSKLSKKTYLYLNIFGSMLIALNVLEKGAYPALVLQVLWVLISLKALNSK